MATVSKKSTNHKEEGALFLDTFSETDFPFLDTKPGAATAQRGKGKRHSGAEALHRTLATRGVIIKSVASADSVGEPSERHLGKRRKARLLSECGAGEGGDEMTTDTPYSLNRKGRWALVDEPHALLADAAPGTRLVEAALTVRSPNRLATAVHTSHQDGAVVSRRAKKERSTANTNTLLAGTDQDDQTTDPELVAMAAAAAADAAAAAPAEPCVQFTVLRPHANSTAMVGRALRLSRRGEKKTARRKQLIDVLDALDEIATMDESRGVERSDDNGLLRACRRSRESSFTLADFIQPSSLSVCSKQPSSTSDAVLVRDKAIEPVALSADSDEDAQRQQQSENRGVHRGRSLEFVDALTWASEAELEPRRASELLDLSAVSRQPAVFASARLNYKSWQCKQIVSQIDALSHPVRWLDAEQRRAVVDCSRALGVAASAPPALVVVLEQSKWRNVLRVLVSTRFLAPSVRLLPAQLARQPLAVGAKNVSTLLDGIITRAQPFWDRHCSESERATADRLAATRLGRQMALFDSALVGVPTTAIQPFEAGFEDLVRMLAAEKQCAEEDDADEEAFERIDLNELDSEDEDDAGELVSREKLSCSGCACVDTDELFERQDGWLCRECVRKSVLAQMRRNQHVDLALDSPRGVHLADVLAAVLPLPLLNHYVRLTAARSIEQNGDGQLVECPRCARLGRLAAGGDGALAQAVSCAGCATAWCSGCELEPHSPLTCAEYAQWSARFDEQCRLGAFGDELEKGVIRITCAHCTTTFEFADKATSARCPGCPAAIEFDPSTFKYMSVPKDIGRFTRKYRIAVERGQFDYSAKVLVPITFPLGRAITAPAVEAHRRRLDASRAVQAARLARLAGLAIGAVELNDRRAQALRLVELGHAWLQTSGCKSSQLRSQFNDLLGLEERLMQQLEDRQKGDPIAVATLLSNETARLAAVLRATILENATAADSDN